MSEPVSDYDAQGQKLETKFLSLCNSAGVDADAALAKVTELATADRVSAV